MKNVTKVYKKTAFRGDIPMIAGEEIEKAGAAKGSPGLLGG